MNKVPLLATVAITEDVPQAGLTRGQIGTVIEHLQHGDERAFLVEFADEEGRAYALTALAERQLLVLHRNRAA